MKILKWISYILAGTGIISILAGIVTGLTNKHNLDYIYTASYFLFGNSLLLITIAISLLIHSDQHKKG